MAFLQSSAKLRQLKQNEVSRFTLSDFAARVILTRTERPLPSMGKPSCQELRRLLETSIGRIGRGALLLSGGIDSSIIACILHPEYSVTAAFGQGAPDLPYARLMAKRFSKIHCEHMIKEKKLLNDTVHHVIRILRSFDPIEIRNSSVAFEAMERARADGYSKVTTGDGADELFAGYNYLMRYYDDAKRLEAELRRLWKIMHFSSTTLGRWLGLDVKSPFLDGKVIHFAKALPVTYNIGLHSGEKFGKYMLRSCFQQDIGPDIAWRSKLAQEQGADTSKLSNLLESMIRDDDFLLQKKKAFTAGVKIRTKEHLYYFRIFSEHFALPEEENCVYRCPDCRGCIDAERRFCRICGAYPIKPFTDSKR